MKKRVSTAKKLLDKYIGIPLIYFLSLFKKPTPFPKKIRTIGILKLAGIGDTVLLAHQVKQLHLKGYKVLYFCHPSLLDIAGNLYFDEIVPVTFLSAWRHIRCRNVDVLIDGEVWARISAVHSYFSLAKYTIGYSTNGHHRHYIFDRSIPHSGELHEIQNIALLFAQLGTNTTVETPLNIAAQNKKERVVCHVVPSGAQAGIRMWPKENWASLIESLGDYEIIFTGSSADSEYVKEICQNTPAKNMCGIPLNKTISLLKEARHLVSVDTGIMHLGAALGIHTIALHGPSNPKRWGPIGPSVSIIQPAIAYTPCLSLGHESRCKKNICMQKITVEQVLRVIAENELLQYDIRHEKSCTHPSLL